MTSYECLEAVMKEALLMSPTKYVEDETQTIFLYDPETNSDLVGSGMTINLMNGATQSPELINGYPSILMGTTSYVQGVFKEPIDLSSTNWTLEWTSKHAAAGGTYPAEMYIGQALITSDGILARWGDSGFGHRYQFGTRFRQVADCWNISVTKGQVVDVETTVALVCRNKEISVFYNGVKQALAGGQGNVYNKYSFTVTGDISNLTTFTIGTPPNKPYNVQPGLRGRVRLSLGARYSRNYSVVPLELDN